MSFTLAFTDGSVGFFPSAAIPLRMSDAPTSVPRPPTATQITISIEFAGANSLGLMMPTCGT